MVASRRLRTLWRVTVERPHVYAHLDMDAFYVSVELQRRPELRGLPVVVAGSGPRAVVTTASYEARRFGVFSATPAERARRLCPDAIFVPPDFEHYRARSREVMAVLRSHVERVEVVGLDEAYLDLTGLDRHRSAARRVKEAVQAETGLTCSVGIGPNKLVAKVASDAEKPDGFVELTAEEARIRFAEASPGLVPGIGPKTVARLEQLGIATLGRLGATLGRPAHRSGSALASARTWPRSPASRTSALIETVRVAKSESRETTFDRDLHGLPQLEPVLERLTGRALRDARARGAARPHDRDQGPLRRLHDGHPGPQPRRRGERRRGGRHGRPRPAQAARPAPPGAASGRARGRARRGVGAGRGRRSADAFALI